MPQDTQARKYQLTINNPADKGLDHDTIKTRLAGLTSLTYACLADEQGLEEQTPHTHIFIATKTPVRFSTMKNRFPEAHIEKAHGTPRRTRLSPAPLKSWGPCPMNPVRATALT